MVKQNKDFQAQNYSQKCLVNTMPYLSLKYCQNGYDHETDMIISTTASSYVNNSILVLYRAWYKAPIHRFLDNEPVIHRLV